MDGLKFKATEKLEALQSAAKSVADNGSSKVQDLCNHTTDTFRRIQEILQEIWHNDFIMEGRQRIVTWTQETITRIQEGVPPLSPIALYEEITTLFKDRVWRRTMIVFVMGCAVGSGVGLLVGLRWGRAAMATGPRCRALQGYQDLIFTEDAVVPGTGPGQVLIRVQAFSVCMTDRAVLRGRGSVLRSLLHSADVTVGRGFAGVVLDTGAGVTCLELGDEVWGCVSEWSSGAASELLVISSSRVSKRPRNIPADAAASLPWAGTACLHAIRRLNYDKNNSKHKRVCIAGAETSEGRILTQLMSKFGAHVTVFAHKHAHAQLKDLGASETVSWTDTMSGSCWSGVVRVATTAGPWDCVLLCAGQGKPGTATVLRSTAPRSGLVDVRPSPLISDRLIPPFSFVFILGFYSYRTLRWLCGFGWNADWLESGFRLKPTLQQLASLVDDGEVTHVLDKVFLPQEFEVALAHACSEDAFGTTVIRFP